MIFVCNMVENIVGKGENAGYQHFLLFPQCFQMSSLSRSDLDVRYPQMINDLSSPKFKALFANQDVYFSDI